MSINKKQTAEKLMQNQISAVEWLENEFKEMCKDFGGLHTDFIERFDQAKQMEKEQIIAAYFKELEEEELERYKK